MRNALAAVRAACISQKWKMKKQNICMHIDLIHKVGSESEVRVRVRVKERGRVIEAEEQKIERCKRLYISQSQNFQNANTDVSSCYI